MVARDWNIRRMEPSFTEVVCACRQDRTREAG
jgi:hypothetical protein